VSAGPAEQPGAAGAPATGCSFIVALLRFLVAFGLLLATALWLAWAGMAT
jgi:hypothetical protein